MQYLRYIIVVVLLSIAVLRHVDLPGVEGAPAGQQAVAGVLHELSTLELATLPQYDSVRIRALDELRKDKSLEFTPPEWFVSAMKALNSVSVQDARVGFENASVRLFKRQSGSAYDSGVEAVRIALRGPDDDTNGKCSDCDGTGKVGDGVVFTTCLTCNGDGVIDDSDRREDGRTVGTSIKERSGDHISRGPACDSAGGNRNSSRKRVAIPIVRRLLGR